MLGSMSFLVCVKSCLTILYRPGHDPVPSTQPYTHASRDLCAFRGIEAEKEQLGIQYNNIMTSFKRVAEKAKVKRSLVCNSYQY